MIELHATVTGKVQGVRYRDYVQQAATNLGLVGSVENLSDGSVFVVAQGMPDVLKEFVEYLHEGSLLAQVDGVAVEWRSQAGLYQEFSILFSYL
ncbi:MAG: Acylphosphatase [Candidatus Parcubacteria bacterium]|jgi:acylphosphatase